MVKIRLARGGRVHQPIYTIVAADSRRKRDGRYLEKLGQYDPNKTDNALQNVNTERISSYVKSGALVSDTVRTLLKKHNVSL